MIRSSVIVMLAALLTGCATGPDLDTRRAEKLPYHYLQFDAEIGWQVKPLGGQTAVYGTLKGLRYQYMDSVEVWVAALDAAGKPVARSVSYLIPYEIRQGEVATFSVTLPVAVSSGTTLRFTYNYSGSDGGDDRGEFRTQSFEAQVP